jgi:hypothetical protein
VEIVHHIPEINSAAKVFYISDYSILKNLFHLSGLKIALLLTLVVLGIYSLAPDFLSYLELKSLDLRFRSRGKIATTGEIALVTIDEKSLDELGRQRLIDDDRQVADDRREARDLLQLNLAVGARRAHASRSSSSEGIRMSEPSPPCCMKSFISSMPS